jgi:bifunctional DNase/RNase
MELSRIIISETNDEQVIVLKEVDGPRAFPIVIGIWEAVAIDRNLKGKKTPRPMTHDLLENVLAGLGATLERIVVTDLRDRTFFAKLVVRKDGTLVDIDSRPSDAIALAVQMQVPIFVAPSVLEDVTPGTGIGGLSEHGPEDEGEDSEEDEVI